MAASGSGGSKSLEQYVKAFLLRPDFLPLLHANERAQELYNASPTLNHILSRVRKDPSRLERFLTNTDLVAFLNLFADTTAALPVGWESRQDSSSGATLFVDHIRRSTTLIDPRLPQSRSEGRSDPPRRPRPRSLPGDGLIASSSQAYHDQIISFLRRPDLLDVLQARLPNLASDPKLRRKLAYIARSGPSALRRYAEDIDLITVLSCLQDQVPLSSSRPSPTGPLSFDGKLTAFYEKLETKGYGQGPGKLRLEVRRSELVKDAFDQLSRAQKRDLQRNKLAVTFKDEDALDYGGPSREFFFLLSRELFNPYYGLFEYSANDTYTVQISPMSVFVDDYLSWFHFCGRVLGLALIHRYLMDTFFTRPFYKWLLKVSLFQRSNTAS